jgi:uncharacterized membrane protein
MPANLSFDNMNDNPTFYKFGMFYFNKHDSRFVIPKATKLGYTVNFAKPYAYIILAVIFISILASIFLA